MTEVVIPFLPRYEVSRTMVDGERAYATPEGNYYSVTTILSGSENNRGLQEWREGIGEKRADEIVAAACWRGDKHHLNIEHLLKTGEEPELNMITEGYWKSSRSFLDGITKPLLIEGAVWSPERYAGTLDCMAYTKEFGNNPVLCDWKTSDSKRNKQKIYNYGLQLAAYREAANHVYKNMGFRCDHAQLVIAIPCHEAQIETFNADQLDQLYRHFLGRKNKFLSSK